MVITLHGGSSTESIQLSFGLQVRQRTETETNKKMDGRWPGLRSRLGGDNISG